MAIELNLPHSLEEIKDAFEHGNNVLGLLKTTNCMRYLTGVNRLVKDLKKNGRLGPDMAKDLEELEAQVDGVNLTLMAFVQTKYAPE